MWISLPRQCFFVYWQEDTSKNQKGNATRMWMGYKAVFSFSKYYMHTKKHILMNDDGFTYSRRVMQWRDDWFDYFGTTDGSSGFIWRWGPRARLGLIQLVYWYIYRSAFRIGYVNRISQKDRSLIALRMLAWTLYGYLYWFSDTFISIHFIRWIRIACYFCLSVVLLANKRFMINHLEYSCWY